jgi:hypothetical protein
VLGNEIKRQENLIKIPGRRCLIILWTVNISDLSENTEEQGVRNVKAVQSETWGRINVEAVLKPNKRRENLKRISIP